jgi:hypothetical protein
LAEIRLPAESPSAGPAAEKCPFENRTDDAYGLRVSIPLLVVSIVAGALLPAGLIVAFVLFLVKKLSPADFSQRPSATGLDRDAAAPTTVGAFRRDALSHDEQPDSSSTTYRSEPEGEVSFRLVRCASTHDAAVFLKRDYRQPFRVTKVAKAVGDHSYFVQKRQGPHTIGWTNAEWFFSL